jgi:hypothetical protein
MPCDASCHCILSSQKGRIGHGRKNADIGHHSNFADRCSGQGILENQLLSAPAVSRPEVAAKARYVLNLYAAGLAPADTHHRDLVAAVLANFARLSNES